MWVIVAVSIPFVLALLIRSKLSKTERIDLGYYISGFVVWFVAGLLTIYNDVANDVIFGSLWFTLAISELIALPILRSRVIAPRIRVKRPGPRWIYNIITIFVFIAVVIYIQSIVRSSSFRMILFGAGFTAWMFTTLILSLFEKVEISRNGVLQAAAFWPWNEYESFSWRGKTNDSFELKLTWRQRFFFWSSTRLLVSPEDREAMQQLLEPNLPELPITMDT